ncbi:hypothetical protein CDAR_588151, partial [Caerostris darwini]
GLIRIAAHVTQSAQVVLRVRSRSEFFEMGKSTPSIPIATRAFDQRGGFSYQTTPSKSRERGYRSFRKSRANGTPVSKIVRRGLIRIAAHVTQFAQVVLGSGHRSENFGWKSTPSFPSSTRAFDQRGLQVTKQPPPSHERVSVISEVTCQWHTSIQNRRSG